MNESIEVMGLIDVPKKEGFVECGLISMNKKGEARINTLNEFPLEHLNEILKQYVESLS